MKSFFNLNFRALNWRRLLKLKLFVFSVRLRQCFCLAENCQQHVAVNFSESKFFIIFNREIYSYFCVEKMRTSQIINTLSSFRFFITFIYLNNCTNLEVSVHWLENYWKLLQIMIYINCNFWFFILTQLKYFIGSRFMLTTCISHCHVFAFF